MKRGSSCCEPVGVVRSCCEGPGVGMEEGAWVSVIWKLGVALALAGQMMVFGIGVNVEPVPMGSQAYWVVHGGMLLGVLVVLGLLGWPLIVDGYRALRERRLSLEGLFLLSIVGALVGSTLASWRGEGDVYYEVVAIVLVIYTVGKTLGKRSRANAIRASERMREDFGEVWVMEGGEKRRVRVEDLNCCSEVVVGPGEGISVDGIVLEGGGYVKETVMTGEVEPVVKGRGDVVWAGSYSVDGVLRVRPTGFKGERRLDQLLEVVEGAGLRPSGMQAQADRVMQWFLPLVVVVSVGTFGYWVVRGPWVEAVLNAMSVLLVACPCALGLATPIAVWSGLWRLSKMGLVARSGEVLDGLAGCRHMIFDKTGTLSEGVMEVSGVVVMEGVDEAWMRGLVGVMEADVEHPVGRALRDLGGDVGGKELSWVRVIAGKGIEGEVEEGGRVYGVRVGERGFVCGDMDVCEMEGLKKVVYVGVDGECVGMVGLKEKMRGNVGEVFREMRELGIEGEVLTGDGGFKGDELEGMRVVSGLGPEEKEERVRSLEGQGRGVIYVGDGVNDAGAMSVSRVGIAMGGGSGLTRSASMGVLMGDDLGVLVEGVKMSRRIWGKVRGNMLFAASYNMVGMSLAACGVLHPVVAALLMLVSSGIVSCRALAQS